jgi:hypothetical protein
MGLIEINPEIFSYWDSDHDSLKYTWDLSVAYALSVGGLTFADLAPHRKSYQ